MPVKVARNQERVGEDAHRVARLRREDRARAGDPRRLVEPAEDRVGVERSREGAAG